MSGVEERPSSDESDTVEPNELLSELASVCHPVRPSSMAPKQRALAALKASFVPPPSTTKRKRTVTIVPDSDDDYGDDDADFDPDRRSSATTSTPAPPASSSRLSRSSSVKKRPKTVRRSAAAGLSVDGESSVRTFGVASTDETVVASSNGLSTRRPPRLGAQSIQSLQRCALDSFSSGLRRLYLPDTTGGGLKADVRLQMSVLPDHLKLLVWQALVDSGSGLVRVDHVLLQVRRACFEESRQCAERLR